MDGKMKEINLQELPAYIPSGPREMAEVMNISGGRSSAGALIALINGGYGYSGNHEAVTAFENTGLEHESCYVFLKELEENLNHKITWLEYTNTDVFNDKLVWSSFSYEKFFNNEYGHIGEILDVERLRSFKYEKSPNSFWYKEGYSDSSKKFKVVDYNSASRNGKPFTDTFLYKCAIRLMKNEGLILPSVGQRWCTGDIKDKVIDNYLKSIGITKYISYSGIRYDEPVRVNRMFNKNNKQNRIIYDAPLHWLQLGKYDINSFWAKQPIDLGLSNNINMFNDFLGNCVMCHLKTKLKKMYLIQNGFSVNFYKQVERITNNFNGDTDAMARQHGTYEAIEKEAFSRAPISKEDVLSDWEKEFHCTGCTD